MRSATATPSSRAGRRWQSHVLYWHRKLAWLGGLALLVWGLSGLLHPLITTFGPQQAVFYPPQRDLDLSSSMALDAILADAGIHQASALRVVVGSEENLLQVTETSSTPRRYFRLDDGSELADHDIAQAEFLARHYLGEQVANHPLRAVSFLNEFTPDYPPVNRLLPVYRVNFDTPDALAAYVYTETGVIAAVDNRLKTNLQAAFRWLHTWSFVPLGAEWLRVVMIAIPVTALCAMAIAGIGLLLGIRRRQRLGGSRGWHRAAGYALALPVIMLSGSGVLHLLQYAGPAPEPNLRLSSPVELDSLQMDLTNIWPALTSEQPFNSLSIVATENGTLLYRLGLAADHKAGPHDARGIRDARFEGVSATGPALYLDALTGEPWRPGDREMALQLAARFTGLPREAISAAHLQTRFDASYDFRNKRLPVWALSYGAPLNATVFVDTTTGVLADQTAHSARIEQWTFSLLHKWTFLRPLGRDGQNLVLSGVVLACVLLGAVLGLRLRWQQRGRQR